MKVVDLPTTANVAGANLGSNKRDLGWEKEFLQQQSRYSGGDSRGGVENRTADKPEVAATAGRHRPPAPAGKVAELARQPGPLARQGHGLPSPGEKMAIGAYKQLGALGSRPEGQRLVQSTLSRLGTPNLPRASGLQTYLARLRGHLVVDSKGGVSIWIGKKLDSNEKKAVIEYVKAALRENGLVLRQLTVAGAVEKV
ncbi:MULTISPECIES: hypothetical protein [Microbulbifer]|uniref:hypothetical protein n=1 Tax=Microbulbifer TaxID=48073 RepID=UPI001F17D7D1|nr:hypothetical protein [Microbulbifer zhoushanensis]